MTVVSDEVYHSGCTYQDYHDRIYAEGGIMEEMLSASERFLEHQQLDLTAFAALSGPVRVLVLSEDWCGDCTDNLPILNRIGEETGKLEFRIASRDANIDLQNQYLKYGKFQSVPTMLFLDHDGTVVGHFLERPESVTEVRARKRQEIYDTHPEYGGPHGYANLSDELQSQLQDALMASREETREFANTEVMRELSELVRASYGQ